MKRQAAFTLIELLIVVAIIAILAAIAVPNFLQAQVRAKVSRSKADMRTLVTGIEAYTIDNAEPPRGSIFQTSTRLASQLSGDKGLITLSTPVSYLTSGLLDDVFNTDFRAGAVADVGSALGSPVDDRGVEERLWIKYAAFNEFGDRVRLVGIPELGSTRRSVWYILQSSGPDATRFVFGDPSDANGLDPARPADLSSIIYDPTNGTVSRGSILRIGGEALSANAGFAFALIARQN